MEEKIDLDLGDGHTLRFTCWKPDRELNPQYQDLPDIERVGAIITHLRPDGEKCSSGIMFNTEVARRVFRDKSMWEVESWEPLTLSPSLLCTLCNDHGFIRNGKWERA